MADGFDQGRQILTLLSSSADEINGDIDLQVNGDHSEEVDVDGEYHVTLSAAKVDALNKAICVAQKFLKESPSLDSAIGKIVALSNRKYHFQPTLETVLRRHIPSGTTGYDWDDREAFEQVISILKLVPLLAETESPTRARTDD